MSRSSTIIAVVVLLAAGAGLYFWRPWESSAATTSASDDDGIYTCPMHPQIEKDGPGVCPICSMELVPKKVKSAKAAMSEGDHAGHSADSMADMIHLSDRDRIIADVNTVKADYRRMASQLVVSAGVDYDEASHKIVSARYGGRIERLYVDQTGQYVVRGKPLMEIYSPELVNAQKEFLIARESQSALSLPGTMAFDTNAASRRQDHADRLIASSKKRLELLGMSAAQIDALERKGDISYTTTVYAPISGTVVKRGVSEGQYVNEGTALLEMIDLSSVWVIANVYENDAYRVHPGMEMTVSGAPLGGEQLRGKVTFIYPTIDAATRTVKVRGSFANPANHLKPGMYVTASVQTAARNALAVPVSAVIRTGKRDIVYVEVGKNMFEPRDVALGIRDGDYFEIADGNLKPSDMVVEQGGYLLDSERQLTSSSTGPHKH